MFNINQGFSLKSAQFNFERDFFKDIATLKAASENDFPDYFITNVAGVLYQIKKSNSVDATTGKWRRYYGPVSNATSSAAGYMSAADKAKLDGIASGATRITVDSALSSTSTNPVQNKIINTALAGKASTAVATQSANGLLSAADKKKLDGITAGGTADSAIDNTYIDSLFT